MLVGTTNSGSSRMRSTPTGLALGLCCLSACMPTGPEARRAAYLDCARDQGLTVTDGTIRTTSAADLARLDACEAIPR
ncbi:hypothetical protein JANAI62_17390 [Jannaschia pagri]|uniref:Lipoprotein n=1 Tax=Jannaschia pagri TaxID=2829797 RepID=A0ABQ4NLA9_9RHOB|nr:hypothetical protein JANAI61_17410 [Jannaschia sp. AI_61]GIT95116.1 hypothetical protein JANAI62_17390 [Jannaschia sp. AI_62]